MKKTLIPLLALTIVGCANPELTQKTTAEFTSKNDVNKLAACISERSDKRTFNGRLIETAVKPSSGNTVTLALVNGNDYVDLTPTESGTDVIYRGEGARPFGGVLKYRNNEVISDIEYCL
ncbi:TPA: hypothetical protein ACKPUX_005233 [Serratia marcescens]|uniref:hypothetical protein n=1 Tax=Serratia marcescens TaxID=615 RepID=UPI0011AB3280|nr:hypothetical protein [Serratia marcescens]HBC7417481.1 hypothetical protein [Serratia marcescens]HBC7422984.1 hypothetical protein [Serratia marcescens]